MKTKPENKNVRFELRTTEKGKSEIAILAKRYGCKESEAVRRAIRHTLATLPPKAASNVMR